MKFTVSMKDPDGMYEALRDAAKESIAAMDGLDTRERQDLEETRHKGLAKAIAPWVEYGEYVTVEFDTEAKTATVLKVKR